MHEVGYKDGAELEFKNNSKIEMIQFITGSSTAYLKNLTMDNTTVVGHISIYGDINK